MENREVNFPPPTIYCTSCYRDVEAKPYRDIAIAECLSCGSVYNIHREPEFGYVVYLVEKN